MIEKVIVSKPDKPRSYNVLTESGKTLNRNRRHLLQDTGRGEEYKMQPNYDFDIKTEELVIDKQSDIVDLAEPSSSTMTRTPTPDKVSRQPEISDVSRTRSGRISKKPNYLRDYET